MSTEDFEDAEFVGRIESGGGVGRGSEVRLGAVNRALPGMRRVLRFGGGHLLKALKGACNVAGHGDFACTAVLIPGEGQATVACAGPVNADLIVPFEGGK
jgi:hypothetical protein